MTIRNRLEKLEGRQSLLIKPDQTEQSKIDILWNVAASGSGSTQIQAIKTLNDMRMAEQIVEKDERSEEEIRGHIETLIAEYRAMPAMG